MPPTQQSSSYKSLAKMPPLETKKLQTTSCTCTVLFLKPSSSTDSDHSSACPVAPTSNHPSANTFLDDTIPPSTSPSTSIVLVSQDYRKRKFGSISTGQSSSASSGNPSLSLLVDPEAPATQYSSQQIARLTPLLTSNPPPKIRARYPDTSFLFRLQPFTTASKYSLTSDLRSAARTTGTPSILPLLLPQHSTTYDEPQRASRKTLNPWSRTRQCSALKDPERPSLRVAVGFYSPIVAEILTDDPKVTIPIRQFFPNVVIATWSESGRLHYRITAHDSSGYPLECICKIKSAMADPGVGERHKRNRNEQGRKEVQLEEDKKDLVVVTPTHWTDFTLLPGWEAIRDPNDPENPMFDIDDPTHSNKFRLAFAEELKKPTSERIFS